MGPYAGPLLGVGLGIITIKFAVIVGFWVEWQRAVRRSRR